MLGEVISKSKLPGKSPRHSAYFLCFSRVRFGPESVAAAVDEHFVLRYPATAEHPRPAAIRPFKTKDPSVHDDS